MVIRFVFYQMYSFNNLFILNLEKNVMQASVEENLYIYIHIYVYIYVCIYMV